MSSFDDDEPGSASLPAERLREMLERLDIGAFRIDQADGTVRQANEAFARMFGFPSAEACAGTSAMSTYSDPKERAETLARYSTHPDVKTKGVLRFEARRVRNDTGEPFDVLISLVPTFDEAGRIVRLEGLTENIGERKRAEKVFRAGSERFRILFETSPVGMALTAPDGVIGRANAALCRFLDRSETELQGLSLLDMVHPDDRQKAEAVLARGADAPPADEEWRFQRGGDGVAWGHLCCSWLEDSGVPHSRVVIIQDVTRHKEAEQLLVRMEKLEAVGLLAGGIAHDFNNIMTAILGNIALARIHPTAGPGISAPLERAEAAVLRARDLTKQLITFARGGGPVRQSVNLVDIARETAALCLCGTSSAFDVSAPPDLRFSEVDPGQMGQVFHNLLLNAAEAMPDGGTIRVRAANVALAPDGHAVLEAGDYVRVEVEDDGEGIPPENVRRIFDPYFSTKKRNTGLGLASVQSIIKGHGGHIEVHSRPGEGTTFSFWIPATSVAAPARAESGLVVPIPLVSRALVMDDDPAVRGVAVAALERAGLEVASAADGAEAISAYRRAMNEGRPFALVLLDLTVCGGMGGKEAMKHLLELDPSVRAIVCSGYSSDPVMSDHRRYGFADVVCKPYTLDQLAAAAVRVLESTT